MAVADINGDQILDLVTSSPTFAQGQLEQQIGTWARRLVPYSQEALAQAAHNAVFLWGTAAVDTSLTLWGDPADSGFIQQHTLQVTGGWYDAIDRTLAAHGITVSPFLRRVSPPIHVPSVKKWRRVAEASLGGSELGYRVCVTTSPHDLEALPAETRSGLVIVLPLFAKFTAGQLAGVRLFRRSIDWLRANEVAADSFSANAEAAGCLPRVVDGGGSAPRDIVVPRYAWGELPRDGDDDPETGAGERFVLDLADVDNPRVLAIVEETGVFQAFIE